VTRQPAELVQATRYTGSGPAEKPKRGPDPDSDFL